MADRTVAVTLKAQVLDFVRGMDTAAAATTRAKKAMQDTAAAAAQHQKALSTVGVGLAAVGATAAAGLFLMVKASTEFGAKMAQLQSLSHASAGEMKQLSDAAMSAGAAYGFSATQVADAEIELTKAGISVKDQIGGALTGALTLAAAGQIDVAQATQITTVAMTQFGLSAAQVPHLADLLAAGADKALGSVGDLGAALANGGLQAHNMGLTIDQTVGTLSAFANAGIIGAEAGTQLRSMFIQIEKPTAKAKAVMEQYGITMYDSQGKFVGMTKLAGELHDKLGPLAQAQRNAALATIFGSYAINGASVLMELGAKKTQGWINAVNDSGFASAQAAGKMNSLQGDLQKLSAAFQTDLIKAGTSADGALRGLVQSVTGVVTAFGALPQPVQGGVVALTAIVAVVGLVGGAVLLAVPKIVEFKYALEKLGTSGRRTAGLIGKGSALLAAILAVGSAFAATAQRGTAAAADIEKAGLQIQHGWKGVNSLFGSGGGVIGGGLKNALAGLSSSNGGAEAAKFFDDMTRGITHFADVYKGNEATLDAMGQQLAGLAKQNYGAAASSFTNLTRRFHLGADEIKNLLDHMPAYRDELVAIAAKNKIAATDTNLLNLAMGKGRAGAKAIATAHREAAAAAARNATALQTLAGKAAGTTTSVKDLKAALDHLDGGLLDARSAARQLQQAFDDATKALKSNGRNLDINTQKGRDNQAALDAIASAAAASAKATLDAGGSAKEAAAIMANGRRHFVAIAEAMGMGHDKAVALARALFGIPKSTRPEVKLTGVDGAIAGVRAVTRAMNGLDGKVSRVTVAYHSTGTQVLSGGPGVSVRKAAGGSIDGPGPKGVDSVPAMLAPGEHVLTAGEVDTLGGQSGVYRMRAAIRSGAIPRYAAGGAVPRSAASAGAAAPVEVVMPDTITVKDVHGFEVTMAVVADRTYARRDHAKAVSGGRR